MTEVAWFDCPYGRINDPFPGQCELYTDTSSDQICDRSQPEGGVGDMKSFVLWTSFIILAVYFVHWYLVNQTKLSKKFKFLKPALFRYFWNLVLLLSFIPVAISGLLWALGVTNFDFSFWHIRLGIVFTLVTTLHLLGRLGYFVRKPW